MKKTVSLLLVLVLCAAVFCGCGKQEQVDTESYLQQIAALQQENEALRNQVEVLTGQLDALQSAVLSDWSLTAKANDEGDGAIINFSAVPAGSTGDITVMLVVTINGFEADSVQCAQEGDRFYATLELPAANGYSYICLIADAQGNPQQIPLVTPDNGVNDALVNLSTSLTAYCNLFVDNWDYSDNKLVITSAYAQAQMPMISAAGDDVAMEKTELVFLHNGEELERKTVTLEVGEAEGNYEGAISDISFTVPKLDDEDMLDLELVVTLTSGETIVYNGCSWYINDGKLNPVMG